MNTRVCVIVVTFNRLETLKTAISHILAQTVRPAEIVIVDNHSTDGTQEYLQSLQGEKNIHCIYLESNTGSAGAISKGMTYGLAKNTFDYFWVIDDDTFYAPNALKDLIDNIEETPFVMLGLRGANFRFGAKKYVDPNIKLQEAEYALLDGALIKTDVVRRIGPVDPAYFMMCDDHEFSIRIRKNGFRLGVLKNGSDDRKYLGGGGQFTKASLWRGYYSARNHTFIIKKHFTVLESIAYVYHQVKLLIMAAMLAPDRSIRVKFRLLGIWHGFKGMGGRTLDPDTLEFVTGKKAAPVVEKFKSPEPGYIKATKPAVTK